MKLTKDAKIFTADGKSIGNLNRFVVDPRSKRISHIVFKQGMLLSRSEHVIPMGLIDHIDSEGIHLTNLSFEVEDLPLFEEDRYIISNEHDLTNEDALSDSSVTGYYYYPPVPFGSTGLQLPSRVDTIYPTDQAHPGDKEVPPVVKSTDQNIPEGSIALKEGAKVVSSDMKHVGDIEKVIVDPGSEAATHLLITKGVFNKEKKLIPLDWVDQILEEEVSLALGEDFIDRLPAYKEPE